MKKTLRKILATSLFVAAGAGVLTACNGQLSIKNNEVSKEVQESEYINVLSTQAVTSIKTIIGEGYVSNSRKAKRLSSSVDTSNEGTSTETPPKEENPPITNVDQEVLSTFEEILNQGKVVIKDNLDLEITKSDLAGYNYLVTINHEQEVYKMYLETLRELIKDNGEEHEFTYKGIIQYKSQEFKFIAEEEVEFDSFDNEEESEIEFKVTIDNETTLLISQSIEVENGKEEKEFEYALYKNRKLVKSYSIEKEETKNGYEVEVEINGYRFKIHYNETLKKVTVRSNNESYEFDYDDTNLENNEELRLFIEELKTNMESNPPRKDYDDDDDD